MPKRTATPLTEPGVAKLAKAQPGQRNEKPDALAPGLILRVNDRGAKSWYVRFRVDGREAKVALGVWPTVTLAEARNLARAARDKAASGVDPRSARAAQASEKRRALIAAKVKLETFGELARQFLAETSFRGAKTAGEFEATLRLHLKPLADVPRVDLHRSQLGDIVAALSSPRRKGGPLPGAARRAYEVARRVTAWAVGRGKLEHDPFDRMPAPPKGAPRERTLSDAELVILWRVWTADGYPFGVLARLLLLTATRRNEVADMMWAELDTADAPTVWTIPASRSKNGLEHRIGLSVPAKRILAEIPRWGGPFVFSTTDGMRPVSGFTTAKKRIDRLVDELAAREGREPLAPWTLHDLRRTARTGLARLGVSREVAERALNHVGGSMLERTYNRFKYEAEVAASLAAWADHVMEVVGERKPARKVVALRG